MKIVVNTTKISLQHESENDGGSYECVLVSNPSSETDIHNGVPVGGGVEIIEKTMTISIVV